MYVLSLFAGNWLLWIRINMVHGEEITGNLNLQTLNLLFITCGNVKEFRVLMFPNTECFALYISRTVHFFILCMVQQRHLVKSMISVTEEKRLYLMITNKLSYYFLIIQ